MNGNKKFYAAIAAFLAIILALSYFVIQSGQQDAYTMLYFSNPIEPLVYNASENTITVNFTIENHENQAYDYAYSISLIQNYTEVVSRKDKISLKNDEIYNISESFNIADYHDLRVEIKLYREGINGTYRSIWYAKT